VRVIPSARRCACEDDSNDCDAVVVDMFVVEDTDVPRRGRDSGVISAADPPAPFLRAAPAVASFTGGLVGVGVSGCGQAEARGARCGGASGVGLVDVATAATGFDRSAGCSGGRTVVGTGPIGVGEDDSACPWESSVVKARVWACRVRLLSRVEEQLVLSTAPSTFIIGTSSASVSVRAESQTACDGAVFGGMMGRLE
jgi:hypothetical protein